MKSTAAIFAVLCLTHLHHVNADVKVHHKSIVATDKKLAFWIESYTDAHLTYALCDKKHPQADEVECTVIREKEPYGNDSYSCDVTLKRPHVPHDKEHLPQISVHPFGKNYAALTVSESRELKFTVVQMESCKIGEAALPYVSESSAEFKYVAVVGHSDSFDVFFHNADLCGDILCKATIDADGRVVNEPKPWMIKFSRNNGLYRPVVALDNGPSGNGYYYVTRGGNGYEHVLVKPDGTKKNLMSHSEPKGILATNENNLLGVSYQMGDNIQCTQYDFDGNLKLNATITSDDKNRKYGLAYNLPNGGFYLASAECKKKTPSDRCNYDQFLIERVDANGAKSGPIMFQGYDTFFKYKAISSLLYESNAKEVCLSVAVTDGGRIELTANCFTDADFSK